MLFVFSINDRIHSVSGDLASARRQFAELTANAQPDSITPRALTLTNRERLDLDTSRARNPKDLFNTMTDAVDAVVDNTPVANALPLPKLYPDEPTHNGEQRFTSFPSATGSMVPSSVDLTPLGLPSLFDDVPKPDYSGAAGSAPNAEKPREIDLSVLGLPKLF